MGCNCSNCATDISLQVTQYPDEAVCEFDVVPPASDYSVTLYDVTSGKVYICGMGIDSSNGNHRVYKATGIGATSGNQYSADIVCLCPCNDTSPTATCP